MRKINGVAGHVIAKIYIPDDIPVHQRTVNSDRLQHAVEKNTA
ncbi:MAG: hypothetical protein WBY44_25900 [Bryobacteraceae bacterium]